MREIKFRAWVEETKKMFYNHQNNRYFGRDLKSPRVALMQYTGLKDKNGKEIYEGDIVTGATSYEVDNDKREWTESNPAHIYWDEEFCAFYPFYLNARWRCDIVDIEVIGNIYENPELLGS